MNGLGSNTCIQDSFNLAWKVAAVFKGQAHPSLLASYSIERQPVGMSIISRANDSFRNHRQIWDNLGMLGASAEERKAAFSELSAPTLTGRSRRASLRAAIEHSAHEFHAIGIEMNQHYDSSAIYTKDELEPFAFVGLAADDPVLYHVPNTYPGSRLPHAWLNSAAPGERISTIDLAGKGGWTLFTGIGGQDWKQACDVVGHELDVKMVGIGIGFRQDFEDVYYDWERSRGVDEDGCVLVRPDRFICWRAQSAGDEKSRLLKAMKAILGR